MGNLTILEDNFARRRSSQMGWESVLQETLKPSKIAELDTLATIALQKMEQYGIISLPVIEKNGILKGVIHLHDILKAGIES